MNELPHPLGPGDKLTGTWISNLLRAVRRMKPLQGPGISTRVTPDGTVISAAVAAPRAAAAPLAPFTVRLHKTEGDPDGLWEIYLPPGCCTVGGSCEPLNPPASETSGHEDDGPYWRSLGKIDFRFMRFLESASGDGSVQAVRGVVEVHVKPSAKEYGVDGVDAPARRLVWACVRDDLLREYIQGNYSQMWDRFLYRDTAGDCLSCDVAAIAATRYRELVDGAYQSSEWTPSVAQHRSIPIDVCYYAWAPPSNTGVTWSHSWADPCFGLVWVFAVSEQDEPSAVQPSSLKLEARNLFCVRQIAAAAGITVTGDDMTDVLDATVVYARVDVTDLNLGDGIVKVLKDPDGAEVTTPYVVWLRLYDIKHNTVVADHRPQSLVNLQLYHA